MFDGVLMFRAQLQTIFSCWSKAIMH